MPASLRGRRNQDDDDCNNGPGEPGEPDPVVVGAVRPIDGRGTNPDNPDFGATGSALLRLAEAGFADGVGEMVTDRPDARVVSNIVVEQEGAEPNLAGASDFMWVWGQFLDHDLDLTRQGNTEPANIAVPAGDPDFDPNGTGTVELPFFRGVVLPGSGTGEDNPREFANTITGFIDASMVYGSDAARAASLRVEGGKIIVDAENNLATDANGRILTGDVRAGENQALLSMHTVFAREHNRLVDELAERDPSLTADELYQAARTRVEAEVQAITYNEYLPMIVGPNAISEYQGFDSSVNPGISLEFATAVFRLGHSQVSPEVQRLLENGQTIEAGNLTLAQAFGASPSAVAANGGIDPILMGLGDGMSQELDNQIVDDLRSLQIDVPVNGITDLASLNIQRGRDLGLPSYNEMREALGLRPRGEFLGHHLRPRSRRPARRGVRRRRPGRPLGRRAVRGRRRGRHGRRNLRGRAGRSVRAPARRRSVLEPELRPAAGRARRAVVDHAVRYHRAQHRHRRDAGQRLPRLRSRRRRRGR